LNHQTLFIKKVYLSKKGSPSQNFQAFFSMHFSGVRSHQRFVKAGKLSKEQGKDLNWFFEVRNVGDYGGTAHVSPAQAKRVIQAAESFLRAVKSLLYR
jgi:uncharacterized protein (UPF0332 family)